MPRYDVLALCPRGMESIASMEISNLGVSNVIEGRGYIESNVDEHLLSKLNIYARTITRVILIIDKGEFIDLRDLKNKISGISFKEYIDAGQCFGVRCERIGRHSFRSIDAAREIGGVIHSQLMSRGVRVCLDDPEIEIVLRIINNRYLIGINTSGESLHKRGYRVYNHPASLNPVIAAGMIYLIGWDRKTILIDPMCGVGTIPIEAAMIAMNIPPGIFRETHKITNLRFIDTDYYWKLRESAKSKTQFNIEKKIIFGIDASPKYIEWAKANSNAAGVSRIVSYFTGDSRRIYDIVPRNSYYSAFNPPYGIRLTRPRAIPHLYREIIASLKDVGVIKGAVISGSYHTMKSALTKAGYNITRDLVVLHGNILTHIYVFSL
jgi:tRNA (guanine6-N2)-methyltransferase